MKAMNPRPMELTAKSIEKLTFPWPLVKKNVEMDRHPNDTAKLNESEMRTKKHSWCMDPLVLAGWKYTAVVAATCFESVFPKSRLNGVQ